MKLTKSIILGMLLTVGAFASYAEPAGGEASVQTVTVSQPQVRVVQGHVEITVPGDDARQVSIYALTGQIIKSMTVAPGVTTIELPAGYYIVKCDRVSCRVVVR